MINTVKFLEWDCKLVKLRYTNGQNALELITNDQEQESVAIASVALAGEQLAEDEIAIKSWSENEGMLECLFDAKVVSEPIRTVNTGFVVAYICKLLI